MKWAFVGLLLLNSYFIVPTSLAQAPLGSPVDPHGRPIVAPSPANQQQYLKLDSAGNQLEVQGTPLKLKSNAQIQTPSGTPAAIVPATRAVNAGAGLSGGGNLTADRTVSMPNVGTPGSYGDSTHTATITTDAQGRVTGVTPNLPGPMSFTDSPSVPIGRFYGWNLAGTNNTFTYKATGYAGGIIVSALDGRIAFLTAPSGTAGVPVVLTEQASMAQNGNLTTTGTAYSAALNVSGPGAITGPVGVTNALVVNGPVTVGGGTAIQWIKSNIGTISFGSIFAANSTSVVGTITVSGAAAGDTVAMFPTGDGNILVSAAVTSANTVTVYVTNPKTTSVDYTSTTASWRATVMHF